MFYNKNTEHRRASYFTPGRQERSMSLPPGVMSFVITLGNEIDVDSSCMLCCHIEV
ncbi:hypothetical protein CLOHYLEM_04458 [[Clostridium] hylemonae DSM 15053]|uniref:Uncharacterized protein n=1 Tax=[Clostridium] hylemonae DSM 15053 TaxID=553973 RepID=C0BXC1_9FIRM|nr:hypothetical protein CLOHYLEM_04458 [[Clostridium] hylemonae DSM 15053]